MGKVDPYRLHFTAFGREWTGDEFLAQGGFGLVYSKKDERIAVKILNPDLLPDKKVYTAMKVEARLAHLLDHENLVHAIDYEETSVAGIPNYAILYPLSNAGNLELIAKNGIHPKIVIEAARSVAKAQIYMAKNNAVHRDIKSANVLCDVRAGIRRWSLTDHGVLYLQEGSPFRESLRRAFGSEIDFLYQKGKISGTLDTISPEQAQSLELTPATDVFSNAAMVYHCLTGAPYHGSNKSAPMAVIIALVTMSEIQHDLRMYHLDLTVIDLFGSSYTPLNGEYKTFSDLLGRALAKEPAARPSPEEYEEGLARFDAALEGVEVPNLPSLELVIGNTQHDSMPLSPDGLTQVHDALISARM